jgi:photosystem II stability/assembly factor-like uncharacterized protein
VKGDHLMENIFLATNGNGIARAEQRSGGQWSLDFLLQGQDVRCLASVPHNSNIIYAGTQGSGVLRSDDSGKTWQPCGLPDQIVKSLAVSPHDPDTIYAGTKPAYMYVSRDGGSSWEELRGFRRIPWRWWWFSPAEKPGTAYVQSIALSPTDPNVLLAGIEFGAVVRSQDGGLTWSAHRRGALRDCHTLKFHNTNGNWAYEAGGTGGGASYSRDSGLTWRKAKAGLAKHYGVACAADPERPEIWYVSVAPGPGKAYGETAEAYLYRAAGGAGWQPIGWEAHPMRHMPITLVTDPKAPGHLYAGLTSGDVWHSTDHGDNWQKLPFNLKGIWFSLLLI